MKGTLKQMINMTLVVKLESSEIKYIQAQYKSNPTQDNSLCIDIDDDMLNEIKQSDKLSICVGIQEEFKDENTS